MTTWLPYPFSWARANISSTWAFDSARFNIFTNLCNNCRGEGGYLIVIKNFWKKGAWGEREVGEGQEGAGDSGGSEGVWRMGGSVRVRGVGGGGSGGGEMEQGGVWGSKGAGGGVGGSGRE